MELYFSAEIFHNKKIQKIVVMVITSHKCFSRTALLNARLWLAGHSWRIAVEVANLASSRKLHIGRCTLWIVLKYWVRYQRRCPWCRFSYCSSVRLIVRWSYKKHINYVTFNSQLISYCLVCIFISKNYIL